ncbi:hypothetical protein K2173_025025 [Erythroxylum novogranatense]|uniref:Uncharacterized protein n=1 Tax=Erythroxylum novogranatense TaxID=1862640 RepID=A0AAV8UCX9_9ROSI|nr:hypothetical protein K2173_025025 [Erythroxylum novogranatense]
MHSTTHSTKKVRLREREEDPPPIALPEPQVLPSYSAAVSDMGPNNAHNAPRPHPMQGPPPTFPPLQRSSLPPALPLPVLLRPTSMAPGCKWHVGLTGPLPLRSTLAATAHPIGDRMVLAVRGLLPSPTHSSLTLQRVSLQRSTLLVPKLVPSRPLLTRGLSLSLASSPDET